LRRNALRFVAVAAGTVPCSATLIAMGVFFFIGGVTVVAGGSLAALYYLVGPSSREGRDGSKHHPVKKHQLSHWR
jgi:hypothetical protein